MKNNARVVWLACVTMFVCTGIARADQVSLDDGSIITGKIKQVYNDKVIITTSFAGELTIDKAKVVSISTDDKTNVQLKSGDTLVGNIDDSVVNSAVGKTDVSADNITMLWPEGAQSPEEIEQQKEHEKELLALTPKWGSEIEVGFSQTEGNTETRNVRGKFTAERTTKDDLLRFYARADYGEQNNERNRNELIGGVFYQNNISERWNWYSRFELEFDEFEDVDLRATIAAGTGYYWIKRKEQDLQTRVGGGYRHQTFDDNSTTDDFILDLGLDYRLDIDPHLQYTHSTTYSPSVEEFSEYLLTVENAISMPLANTDNLRLKFGVLNQYNSRPRPGNQRLDNTYYANLVWKILK